MNNLTPALACQLLNEEFGIKRTPATLAKLRCVGGSPIFLKANRAVLYPRESLRDWARLLLSPPKHSTSSTGSQAA